MFISLLFASLLTVLFLAGFVAIRHYKKARTVWAYFGRFLGPDRQ